jgi:agmatine deiminase
MHHQSALDAGFHMPAEWTPHSRCWIAWPTRKAIWGEHLQAAKRDYASVARAIAEFEPVCMLCPPEFVSEADEMTGPDIEVIAWDLEDSWMRDIGPNFLKNADETAVSVFQFNAWGRKYRKYRKDAAMGHRMAEALGIRCFTSPIYMEGGGFCCDGEGTVLTTEQCILNENRNPGISKAEAEHELRQALGVEKVIWLPGDPLDDETDGHVDGLACFIRPGVVLAEVDPDPASEGHEIYMRNVNALQRATDARGRKLEVHHIETAKELGPVGDRFCGAYVNFYMANGGIIMPGYGTHTDARARAVVESCFPDRRIAQIEINGLATGGGGIHCITQQQPA